MATGLTAMWHPRINLPGFSIPTDVKPIREELARVVPHSELLELGYLDCTAILPLPARR